MGKDKNDWGRVRKMTARIAWETTRGKGQISKVRGLKDQVQQK